MFVKCAAENIDDDKVLSRSFHWDTYLWIRALYKEMLDNLLYCTVVYYCVFYMLYEIYVYESIVKFKMNEKCRAVGDIFLLVLIYSRLRVPFIKSNIYKKILKVGLFTNYMLILFYWRYLFTLSRAINQICSSSLLSYLSSVLVFICYDRISELKPLLRNLSDFAYCY